jgi:hypothetical protein
LKSSPLALSLPQTTKQPCHPNGTKRKPSWQPNSSNGKFNSTQISGINFNIKKSISHQLQLQIISHNIHNASELQTLGNNYDNVKDQTSAVAMGGGEEAFYEKKLSKEEKKALAAKKREEKRKAKSKASENALKKGEENDGVETNEAAEQLASEGTICTFSTSRKGVDARSRDVNVQNFTLQHKGNVMLDGTSIVLNHGNRYGLIGRNGESLCFLCSVWGAGMVWHGVSLFMRFVALSCFLTMQTI